MSKGGTGKGLSHQSHPSGEANKALDSRLPLTAHIAALSCFLGWVSRVTLQLKVKGVHLVLKSHALSVICCTGSWSLGVQHIGP